jgi:DNA-directed RNA polymerase subunit E'/Rpb7
MKNMPQNEEIFDGILKHETPYAILVEIDNEDVWLPKSQIEYDENAEVDDDIEVIIPEWLADEKGLI